MVFQSVSKWFLTKQGKHFSFLLAGTATLGVSLAHFLPHTFLLDRYKEVIHLYRKGVTVPLSKELHARFQKVLDILEVEPDDKKLFKPFHVYGFELMSAGSSRSIYGAIIGIPINFSYRNVNEAHDKPIITVDEKDINWDSETGKKLLSSLILSENAQLYGMAREIKMRQTLKSYLDMIYGTSATLFAYGLATNINVKGNLYSKPLLVRLFMYSMVASFCFVYYLLLKDSTTIFYEKSVDKDLTGKNVLFIEGGKEFYSKIVERNIALREIMGSRGEGMYTPLGNENTLIRTSHIPPVQRKAFFEELLAQNVL